MTLHETCHLTSNPHLLLQTPPPCYRLPPLLRIPLPCYRPLPPATDPHSFHLLQTPTPATDSMPCYRPPPITDPLPLLKTPIHPLLQTPCPVTDPLPLLHTTTPCYRPPCYKPLSLLHTPHNRPPTTDPTPCATDPFPLLQTPTPCYRPPPLLPIPNPCCIPPSALRFGSKPGPARGSGLYIISQAGPGPTYCGPGPGLG